MGVRRRITDVARSRGARVFEEPIAVNDICLAVATSSSYFASWSRDSLLSLELSEVMEAEGDAERVGTKGADI